MILRILLECIMSTVADNPVKTYDAQIGAIREAFKQYTPYTYLSYRSLIPKRKDDFLGLVCRIKKVVTLVCIVVTAATLFSPIIYIVPFIPFVMDAGRAIHLTCKGRKFALESSRVEA